MLLILDGANGTELHKKGIKLGEIPEILNITNPKAVYEVHKSYVLAGSKAITLNTFGANAYKLKDSGYSVTEVIKASIALAKDLGVKKILDIGPIGQMLTPIGSLTFDEAYNIYQEMILAAKDDVDIILFETQTDIYELKAGILAAKENAKLPIYVSMTFDENQTTLTGSDPKTFVRIVEALGVDALGVNCSLGPIQLLPIVKEIMEEATIPVLVQANAGMPLIIDGKTVFNINADEYVKVIGEFLKLGVQIIGGCCGTTPEFIQKIVNQYQNFQIKIPHNEPKTYVTSGVKSVLIDEKVIVCGERINPTGRKKLKEDLQNQIYDSIIKEAILEEDAKADILDVNVGVPLIDEVKTLKTAIEKIQEVVNLPLQIDSSNHLAIEKALRYYNGIPLVNSINGKKEVMDNVFPLIRKYGAKVIALLIDEEGIPLTASKRIKIANKIIDYAKNYGLGKNDIIFDGLVLTASAQQDSVKETLITINELNKMGLKSVLGVSNVSFGLPNRQLLNKTFLACALANHLNMAIINPLDQEMMNTIKAFNVLYNIDHGSEEYLNSQIETNEIKPSSDMNLFDTLVKGFTKEAIHLTKKALTENEPMKIINEIIVPALALVGDDFSKKKIFLPQLIKSAETVKEVFLIIQKEFKALDAKKGPILLATVFGDVHDIGKNIVKVLLESYGYLVIDLGKDVLIETIIDAYHKHQPKVIGLSALMTTTVQSMEDTIKALRNINVKAKIIVGGAVLNQEIASKINADFYAKDALESVEIVNRILG